VTSFQAITPADFPWFDYSRYTFSLGLRHDRAAYLSGHSASEYDPDAGRIVVTGGMAEQTRTAYAKIERILEAAGLGFEDVIRITENVTKAGIDDYAAAAQVRAEVFGERSPAVNTVCVDALLRPAALIEIEVVAGPEESETSFDSHGRRAVAGVRAAEGIVYLSSILPTDEHGEIVGPGDLKAQAEQIYVNAAAILAGVGLDTAAIAKTVDFIRLDALADYKRTGRVRADNLTPPYPGATGILMSRLAHPDALLQVDLLATTAEMETINPGWERYGKLTYSPAVRAGNVLFMSGQAALDPATETAVHPGDIAAQAEYTYGNILAVLDAAGAGPEHLVKTIEYVTPQGLPRYREVAAVRTKLLHEPWPASTGIVCAALLRPEFEIEIDPLALLS
jgi:enamine deaminase RidA (YjgF/YER057c/UK114 family)